MNDNPIAQACNCLALRQAARFVTQLYERHLATVGVTPAQFSIMANLAHRPGLLMSELAETLVMDRTTLLRALKPLQRDGFVATAASEHDARAHALSLTKLGEHTYAQAKIAWQAAQDEFETQFGQGRAKALRDELFSLTAQR
ncbi:MarR family transcriptional regulator [Burkholderia stabilis]|uniref:Benzoate anaerobic degradation regulator,Predicted nucleic-acid-binding protein, contains PIN domain,homoprotocatechuate degradation operon regulator, HpaR,MarR family n=1 Tax=Burkholderia stabilis TaxID=95485 RepID=A0AAJ5NIB7_9BURK|nr:MarR family winged helix-turn-helix transcriptional regulator [Burkholderia stabilis]AOR71966.1 MarR family transcriptional regulator [Burkholderia stabilis]VBB16179.1 Benzoate anaerobic degradation regulator,Predicted nucleic-acid-binding protein, contains PIN domain,homoprotocatechuate degradation operon regulator, HpaR,MarR family [Burkholderia stabilis]HDR9488680.1 winged helix-turn-helix transcriptional regulator [Burkholderia stabilis]HDR9523663.1 winged helix-turn-helix transcriptiona